MMDKETGPGFHWYDQRAPDACPPKSMFVILLMMIIAAVIPAGMFWYMEQYSALTWLASASLMLAGCLLFDALSTYRRYKEWGSEWLCSNCRSAFKPGQSPQHQKYPAATIRAYSPTT
jgi:hypothetical protein